MGSEEISNGAKVDDATPSEIEKQIIRQIEYYFGDYNLSRDKFLREQLKADDGWVPLELMVKFNRLKKLSSDFNVIAEALKKSSKKIMEINEDNTKIRRANAAELPEDYKSKQTELGEKTLYVKGFKKDNTLDDLLDFFKDYGVENIHMRRAPRQGSRPFKGSVFVTFDSKEDANTFLTTKGIKYKGTDLLREWKKDYVIRKDEFYKNLREEKAKKLEAKANSKKETADEKKEEDTSAVEAEPEDGADMVRGCLLKLNNLGKEVDREKIKEAFENLGTVVYVDYHHGLPSATVRFETAEASSALEKIPEEDGKRTLKIGSSVAEVLSIEGDEEEQYWKHISVSRKRSREFNKQKYGFRGGRFKKQGRNRGQRQGKRGHDGESEQQAKKIKEESKEPATSTVKDEDSQTSKKRKNVEDTENGTVKTENMGMGDKGEPAQKKTKVEPSEKESPSKNKDNSASNVKHEVIEPKMESD